MHACGIDFGTSNSTIALTGPAGIEQLNIDPRSSVDHASPTLLYFGEACPPVFGTAAVSDYLAAEQAGRLIQSIKRHLPARGFDGTWIEGKKRSIEELVAGYLRYLKATADEVAGVDVRATVLGRPARYHTDPARDRLAEDRMRRAAGIAGFQQVAFQIEPIAAARRFEQSLDREVLCFVGDLGGGTSDFTVIRLSPARVAQSDRTEDVLGVAGVSVGGNDFDARIMQRYALPHLGHSTRYRPMQQWLPIPSYLHMAITRWHTACMAGTAKNLRALESMMRTAEDSRGLARLRELLEEGWFYRMFQSVEAVKIALSAQRQATLRFAMGSIDIAQPIEREDFEQSIRLEVSKLEQCIDGLLSQLSLTPADITVAFLTGGSSKIPCVQRIFRERFGERIVATEAFTSVGHGLGVEAAARYGS